MFDRKGNRKYPNGVERAAFLRAINGEPDFERQLFCLTLFYTGCRISEGLNLTSALVDLAEKAVVFETLKRRKRGHFRSVPIPDDLAKKFKKVLTARKSSERIWKFSRPTGYRLIKARMKEAGLKGSKACPKGLRHGFAVACVKQSIPITAIKKWLGHARLETTAIYLEVAGDEERELAKRIW